MEELFSLEKHNKEHLAQLFLAKLLQFLQALRINRREAFVQDDNCRLRCCAGIFPHSENPNRTKQKPQSVVFPLQQLDHESSVVPSRIYLKFMHLYQN